MQYLTIEAIKTHSRIDYDCEDVLIGLYGAAAEKVVLNQLGKTLDELMAENDGIVPPDIIVSTLEIADNMIRHRSTTEQADINAVPYGFDMQMKTHMKL